VPDDSVNPVSSFLRTLFRYTVATSKAHLVSIEIRHGNYNRESGSMWKQVYV
jgi:DNA-binding CsgD family transcriptional regulator